MSSAPDTSAAAQARPCGLAAPPFCQHSAGNRPAGLGRLVPLPCSALSGPTQASRSGWRRRSCGTSIGDETQHREDIAILPALATVLIGVHLVLIQWFGMSVPPGVEAKWQAIPEDRKEIRFFPNFVLRELMAWYVELGLLGGRAALFPWGLGVKADPFASAPAGCKPEGYFRFTFRSGIDGLVRGVGASGGAGGAVSMGPRGEGRPVCLSSGGHQARVVLPVHVPDAKADSCEGPRYGRRDVGHSGVWSGRSCSSAAAVPRP